jgi:hypothetical protein
MSYMPSNWYWIVAGDCNRVWSSGHLQYILASDATYEAWIEAGNRATRIDSVSGLSEVMQRQAIPMLQSRGVEVVSNHAPSINGPYAIDSLSQTRITALSAGIATGKPLPGGGDTFNYADFTGANRAFSAADFLDFASAIEDYVYAFDQAVIALVFGLPATLPLQPVVIHEVWKKSPAQPGYVHGRHHMHRHHRALNE